MLMKIKEFIHSTEAKILFLLLMLGAAVRILGAWCLRHNLNLDAGVVGLMAKHISEGSDYPVFFYGQPHMGSLEAFVSAFFMKSIGLYGFGVTLGTAFVAFLLLPVVYVWARDIGGPTAGCAALTFIILGPMGGFYHYAVSPRGGYAACLLFATTALWLSTRIAKKTLQNGQMPCADIFYLGLAGGFGWWSNQLVLPALLASIVTLVLVLRNNIFSARLSWGIAGFFGGSLPFWAYNIQNDWATFTFSESFGQTPFVEGLYLFFVDRMLLLTGLSTPHPVYLVVAALIYLATLATCAWLAVQARRQKNTAVWISLLAMLLFIGFSALVASTSHFINFYTPRYNLPIIPILAIFLGAAVSVYATRVPPVLAWIPLIVLIIPQFQALSWAISFEKDKSKLQARIERVGDFLENSSITGVYTQKVNRSWTFALKEKVILSDIWEDFHLPNAQFVDLTENPAVLDGYGGVADFLQTTGGAAKEKTVAGFLVHHDFEPARNRLQPILPTQWESALDSTGQNILMTIANPFYPQFWGSPRSPREDFLEIAFHEPVVVSGLRLLANDRKHYPRFLQIEGQVSDGQDWLVLHPASGAGLFYWSGNRPYPFGEHYRMEAFFQPTLLEKLRIVNKADIEFRRDFRWGVQHLQLFGPGPELPLEEDSLPLLLALLQERNLGYLYADRWVSNAVYKATQGRVWTPLESDLFPENHHPLEDQISHVNKETLLPIAPGKVMLFDSRAAMLARLEDVPLVQRCLNHADLKMRETVVGPWVLFDFAADQWPDKEVAVAALRWTGYGCIPVQIRSGSRQIFPEEAGHVGFFYPDNNWTTGNAHITGLSYHPSPEDRYLVLRLKGPHPHGHDATSLGIQVWVNKTRLPLVHEQDLDFYFWLGESIDEIREIRIQSRSFVPKDHNINDDPRELGLMVNSISLQALLGNASTADVIEFAAVPSTFEQLQGIWRDMRGLFPFTSGIEVAVIRPVLW
jgi:4-amino-4-deoxy-L-arabinose transferase-like glycosyltransferase